MFPVNKEEQAKEEEEEKARTRISSTSRMRSELHCGLLYQCNRVVLVDQGNFFFPVNEEEEEEESKHQEDEIRTTMQS